MIKRSVFAAAMAATLVLGCTEAPLARAGEDLGGRLAAFDSLVRTGRATKLRAKLEGKGMLGVYSDIEGEFLDFWLTGEPAAEGKPGTQTLDKEKFLGSGKTDSSGIGELEWTPEKPGAYEVEVRVRKGSKYVAIPATLDVLVAAPDRPMTVVTIEQTLTDLSALSFMRKDEKDISVADGAAEALGKIAEKHAIVYLTGIEEVSLVKTKDWLKKKGFPRGPVFFWNVSENAFKGETYKTNALAKLHSDFPALTSAVGGKTEDANAALRNGVTSFVVSADSDLPAEAIRMKKWDKLPAAIARQHEVEELVSELAATDVDKQEKAGKALARLETGELGYLNRLLRTTDPSTAAAARLVLGRIRARDAFAQSLDLSSDSTALASILAAWRGGDPTVAARCYRDGASGLGKAGPPVEHFRGIEVVNRTEPEPGKVVYRLRFLVPKDGPQKDNVERDYAFVRGEDGQWRVDAGDL